MNKRQTLWQRMLGEFVRREDQSTDDAFSIKMNLEDRKRCMRTLLHHGLIKVSGMRRVEEANIPMYSATAAGVAHWESVKHLPTHSDRTIKGRIIHKPKPVVIVQGLAKAAVARCPVDVFDLVRSPKTWAAGDRDLS